MISRRRFIAISAAAGLASPARATAAVRWSGIALGAEATLTLDGPEEIARPALDAALTEIRKLESYFSLYDPDSVLSRLNRDGAIDAAPPEFLHLFKQIDRIHAQTGGLFDPTIQGPWAALARSDLRSEWGFVGWTHVQRLDAGGVRLFNGQQITLNGIAQGYITDRVVEVLKNHGLTDAFVDIGEQSAIGAPRRLALEDPAADRVGTVTLRNTAIATSSPMATPLAGRGHILHPKGPNQPLRWSTVSVEATSATLADGLSTALCLADLPRIRRIKGISGVRRILLVDPGGDVRTL
ncbi:FAD:protein FMN transferase [Aestuariibius insulae]|uniref:FAD:protein FMN transferase n=1 Tax=Aestuariibius insulae TaxID=2058287 RepID=UPI00345ED4B0